MVAVEISGMEDGGFHRRLQECQADVPGIRERRSGICANHHMESFFDEFSTAVKLPVLVETDAVETNYADGSLVVSIPELHRQFTAAETVQAP